MDQNSSEPHQRPQHPPRQNADAGRRPQAQRVSVKEIAAKYSSKRELYQFLAEDVGFYLPDHRVVTMYFLRDLISGEKKGKCTECITS